MQLSDATGGKGNGACPPELLVDQFGAASIGQIRLLVRTKLFTNKT